MSYKDRIKNVTIGSDPEAFLWSNELGKFVPACGLIGGTKQEPKAITNEGHAIQEDNVSVEWCIPPSKTAEEFYGHIQFVKNYLQDTILNEKGLELKCVSSARFNYDELQSEQAQTFGCDPSFNPYTFENTTPDRDKADPLLRSSGFHIHVGYDNPDVDVSIQLSKAFDLFVLVPSVLLDSDSERRTLYGEAGSMRFKSYGAEYRGLGSYFLQSEELIKWVFNQTMRAIEFINEGGIITNESEILECINTSNKDMAMEIVDDYRINVLTLKEV